MMEYDASWCISCDRLIAPKRYQVPIPAPPTLPPPPPPSSPQSSPTKSGSKKTKNRKNANGGLLNGTGRVRTNGSIKAEPTPPPPPAPPIRYRTIIDQSPQGLYCSDECRMADLNSTHAGLPVHPDRSAPFARPSPPRSEEVDPSKPKLEYHHTIITMAKNLNFPPLPDLNTICYGDSSDEDDCYHGVDEWTGGLMMEARRMKAVLPELRKPPTSRYEIVEPSPKMPPGWMNGSSTAPVPVKPDNHTHMGKPCGRSSRRSRYTPEKRIDPTPELMANFHETFARRAESRLSSSPPSGPSQIKRERSLLASGAEGKLLVPDVKLKVRSGSSSSISSGLTSPSSSRRSVRSPLSASTEEQTIFPLRSKRPAPETRSWSYDNVLTYPTMPLPTTTVRRKEIQVIDGKEVEVVVEFQKPPQRLFLFPTRIPITP